jgi:hypothetical protein
LRYSSAIPDFALPDPGEHGASPGKTIPRWRRGKALWQFIVGFASVTTI